MSTTAHDKRPASQKAESSDANQRPEAFALGIGAWILALSVEVIQQVLGVVGTMMDNNELLKQTNQMAQDRGVEITEGQARLLGYISMGFVGLLGLAIIAILFYIVHKVASRGNNADSMRRLLNFFSGYLLFKALVVTFSPPSGNLPVAFYAASGVAQIIVGVAAVVGAVLLAKKESVEWINANKDKDETPRWGGPQRSPRTNGSSAGNKPEESSDRNKDSDPAWKSVFGKKKDQQTKGESSSSNDEKSEEPTAKK